MGWSVIGEGRGGGSFSSLMLILGVLSLMGIQAAHHKHEIKFTAVGTRSSLLDLTMVNFVDDIQIFSYDKQNRQLKAKEAWITEAVGAKFMVKAQQKLMNHEKSFLSFLKKLMQNDTKNDMKCTVQLLVCCEIERNNQIGNEIQFAVDGQDFFLLDQKFGYWVTVRPEAEPFKPMLMSSLWTIQSEQYMKEYCVDTMEKVLQHSNIRKNMPPEITVSYHEAKDGIITLSCSATGFYPSSILLHWQKGKNKIVDGKESSSGPLPNADSTFYERKTIELLLEDAETDYDCIVDHIEFGTLKVYPVYVKPSKKRSWPTTLAILSIVILVLSCAASFIVWKKMKTGFRIHECITMEDSPLDLQGD